MFKKIALIAMMAFSLSLPMTAFATELNTLAITDTTQELSVSQMVLWRVLRLSPLDIKRGYLAFVIPSCQQLSATSLLIWLPKVK